MSQRVVIVGIDEAGYGPLLGPLVVSASAFEAPADLVDTSLWKILKGSVSSRPRPRDRRLPIVDSKQLHQGRDDLAPLERSALAAVTAWRGLPPTRRALLTLLCPAVLNSLGSYPWYGQMDGQLPVQADRDGIRLAGNRLRDDAAENGVALAGLFCEPVPEGEFNRRVAGTRNKATVLSDVTTRLIQRVSEAIPGRTIHFFADKQGGRGFYGPVLLRAFEDRRLAIVEETPEVSRYELTAADVWTVRFVAKGETAHLPVALASIISKYVRELFMNAFNAFWQTHVPDIAGTAGYYGDGSRFIRQIVPHLPRLGIDVKQLVRTH